MHAARCNTCNYCHEALSGLMYLTRAFLWAQHHKHIRFPPHMLPQHISRPITPISHLL